MRALTSRLIISRNLLSFCPSSPSRLFLSRSRAGFSAMAESASLCVSSDDATRPLSQSIQNRASEFTDSESLSHELKHSDHDQSNNSPLREQGRCTEAEAASTSERNGHQCKGEDGKVAVKFQLKNSCVLALQRGDITKWRVDGKTDGIVNAANTRMLGGGGVDGAIHRVAGPDLYEACLKLPFVGKGIRCLTGNAVITKGFRLPVSKIVHTVGPMYDDNETSGPLLESSYKNSLSLAVSNGIKYLAFPAISCGIYGYPYDEAAEIALNTVNEHSAGLKEVHFVLFEEGSWVQWLSKACRSFQKLE